MCVGMEVCVWLYIYVCVCVRVCVRARVAVCGGGVCAGLRECVGVITDATSSGSNF